MTPKEKAKELVDKFKYINYDLGDINNHKECALIAVEEILNVIEGDMNYQGAYEYFTDVETEIEKL